VSATPTDLRRVATRDASERQAAEVLDLLCRSWAFGDSLAYDMRSPGGEPG
jgi:hypothetical protein